MPLIEAERIDITSLVNGHDIECECMLSPGHRRQAQTGRVEAHLPVPRPYPGPGLATMLMCNECYGDWVDHPEEFGGFLDNSHRV